MLDSFTCPFCNHTMPVIDSTYWSTDADFRKFSGMTYQGDDTYNLKIRMYKCPNCETITSFADYLGSKMPQKNNSSLPFIYCKTIS